MLRGNMARYFWQNPRVIWLAVVFTLFRTVGFAGADEQLPDLADVPGSQSLIWRSDRVCGLNCLYVMLRLNDIDTDYQTISQELLSSQPMTSLTDLAKCAQRSGLPCCMAKTAPSGLDSLPKPLIAHFEIVGDELPAQSGHFILVLATQPDSITVMDGSLGTIRPMSRADFEHGWTGYVLFVDKERRPSAAHIVLLILGGLLAGIVVDKVILKGLSGLFRRTPKKGAPILAGTL